MFSQFTVFLFKIFCLELDLFSLRYMSISIFYENFFVAEYYLSTKNFHLSLISLFLTWKIHYLCTKCLFYYVYITFLFTAFIYLFYVYPVSGGLFPWFVLCLIDLIFLQKYAIFVMFNKNTFSVSV